jgi:hypothetical protein
MNVNDYVRIKPSEYGWQMLNDSAAAFNVTYGHFVKKKIPEPDQDGYITMQFWDFMSHFDWTKGMILTPPFIDMKLVK